jgi:hypothetical protein
MHVSNMTPHHSWGWRKPASAVGMPAHVRGYPQAYDHLWITLKFREIDHTTQFGQMTLYPC